MAGDPSSEPETTLYEAAGGMPFFVSLVDAFYEGIVTDAVLLPLYPADDLHGARHRLTLFLAQYWGCLLYTSDAADDLLCVDIGGCRIIKKKIKKSKEKNCRRTTIQKPQ